LQINFIHMKQFISLLTFLFLASSVYSQGDLHKSLFINSFIKNIEWPEEYKTGNIVVAVYSDDFLATIFFNDMDNVQCGSQLINVKIVNTYISEERYHILYVTDLHSTELAEICEYYKNTSTLIVSETLGVIRQGADINLVVVNGRLMYELMPDRLNAKNLKYSEEFLKRGREIH